MQCGVRSWLVALSILVIAGGAAGCASKSVATDAELRERAIRSATDNTPAQNREIAWGMIRDDYPQWDRPNERECLEQLWFKESRWNHRAVNKRTGACGIPQSYPCNKMREMGQRYRVSYRKNPWPQIAWGLAYIEKRYGAPCKAWKRFKRGGGY